MKANLTQNEIDKHVCIKPDYFDYTTPIVEAIFLYEQEHKEIDINVASFASNDELLQFCKDYAGEECIKWFFGFSNFPNNFLEENSLHFDDIIKLFALEDEDERGAVWAYLDQYNKYFSVDNILSVFIGRFDNIFEFTQYILSELKHDQNAYAYECDELEEYYNKHLDKYVVENEGYFFKRNNKTNFAEL